MEMPPPPYQGRKHLKKLSEFVAELTPEKIDGFIAPTYPAQFGDDWSSASVQRLVDAEEKGERELIPIQERIDALTFAEAEGWTPIRSIENQLGHLRNVICGRYVAKYLKDILQTLQEAEADLAIWQQMTEAQRDERWDARERDKIEAEERRKQIRELEDRKNRLYDMMPMGICPKKGTPVRLHPRKGTPLDILLTNITDPHFTGTI